ncbi:GNAT family N-acetyltransferase [Blastococcus sp. SYSU DS0533]
MPTTSRCPRPAATPSPRRPRPSRSGGPHPPAAPPPGGHRAARRARRTGRRPRLRPSRLHPRTGDDVLDLDDLHVRPGHRDAGVGRQLMAALAAPAEPDQLLIRWGVEVENADAQRFYRRLTSARPLPEDR